MQQQRFIICIAILVLASHLPVIGRDDTRNSITLKVMLDSAGISHVKTINYYDGLGRKEEVVQCNASPNGNSLISYIGYDMAGRERKVFQPAVAATGEDYVSLPQIQTLAASIYGDQAPNSLIEYEQSALDRVLCAYGSGYAWQNSGKGVKSRYLINRNDVDTLKCRMFSVNDTYESGDTSVTISNLGYYAQGSLYVNSQEDEDGHIALSFMDKQGRVVLSRSLTGLGGDQRFADTYYVYDDRGQLTAVLPPMASKSLNSSGTWNSTQSDAVKRYVFLYSYNTQGLCVGKKLPGCAWQRFYYDKGMQLVYSQNGNLRSENKMMISLCDSLGRNTVTGIVNETDVVDLSNAVAFAAFVGNSSNNTYGYTANAGINLADVDILSVNYYDDYSFLSTFASDSSSLDYKSMADYSGRYIATQNSLSARGLLTGTATRVLGDTTLLVKSIYYDAHDNVIQTHETNALGGFEHYYTEMSFTGKPLKVKHVHETADTLLTDVYQYSYDNMVRLLTTTVSHDSGAAVTLASNTYNGLGQLTEQSLGGHANGVVDYTYNVRGWTQGISSPHFSQTLYYEQPGTGATPCYNGNVSAMDWTVLDAMAAATPTSHRYTFDYDGLNRLTAAHYGTNGTQSVNGSIRFDGAHNYSTSYGYDLNGNITSLTRKGVNSCITVGDTAIWSFGDIDNLSLTYNGNQLKKVTDQCADLTYAGAMDFKDGANKTVEYLWDTNGNMTRDRNKKIWTIKYNVLNLPEQIEYMDGHIVQYTYAADGRKLMVKYMVSNISVIEQGSINGVGGSSNGVMGGGIIPFDPPGPIVPPGPTTYLTMDYCGNHVYRNGVMERTMNDYGYQADSTYYYYIKDYQGNVRAVIDQNGVLKEINNYYPYGGLMGATSAGVQPHKYGGKELDRENGIDWYDSQARFYDQLIGRTTTMDPMAEKYYSVSPYSWCADNPMRFVDNNGKDLNFLGEDKVLAFNALKSILGKQGDYFTMSENGSVSYSTPDGVNLKGAAKRVSQIIDENSIKVRIQTTRNVVYNNHTFVGGMFYGNTYNEEDGVVTTLQVVNMRTLGILDEMTNSNSGTLLLHEVTESYEGGKISLGKKQSAPAANDSETSDPNSVYNLAHGKATTQPFLNIDELKYDRNHHPTEGYENLSLIKWVGRDERIIQLYVPFYPPNVIFQRPSNVELHR